MRKNIDNIEIKEPPLEEFKKKRSCLKRSCSTGCGCLIIVIIIFILLLKFVAVPRPKELKALPENFPQIIPIYDIENVEYITFLSGKQRNRILELAGYIPKVVLVPIFIYAEDYAPTEIKQTLGELRDKSDWQKFTHLMGMPITDRKDTFEIEWIDLPADPEFIQEFYLSEFKKGSFEIDITTESKTLHQIIFSKNSIEGVLYIKDDPAQKGTDITNLTISLPL